MQGRTHHATLLRTESFIYHFVGFSLTFRHLFSSKYLFRTTPRIIKLGTKQKIMRAKEMVLSCKHKGVLLLGSFSNCIVVVVFTSSSGRWTLDSGRSNLVSGCWTLDCSRWTPDARIWTLDIKALNSSW